jgi:Leucine-rich repeat (LRR) protein
MVQQAAFARELHCYYRTASWDYWPKYKECQLSSIDLSEVHKAGGHSISGSWSEKSGVSGVQFYGSNVVDFIPAEVTREFPELNAVVIDHSNVPVIKKGLLGRDFKRLELLVFWSSKVKAIEDGAFTELENLKNIWIAHNPLKVLPFGLFRNNLKLEIAYFYSNKISMIHPALFDDLTNLKFVHLNDNLCVSKSFGCRACSVFSQSELKSELASCFANYEANPGYSNSLIAQEEMMRTIKQQMADFVQKQLEEFVKQLRAAFQFLVEKFM